MMGGAGHKPMSIALFTPGFPKDRDDSTCLPYVQDWLMAHQRAFPRDMIDVFSFQYPFDGGSYAWHELRVTAFGGSNRRGFWRLMTWLRVTWAFISKHHSRQYDIIHALWLDECSVVATWLGSLLEVPVVLTIMGQDSRRPHPWVRHRLSNQYAVTACSTYAANFARPLLPASVIRVVHWGVAETPSENHARDIDILGVGSLIPLKNYDTFLEILSRLIRGGLHVTACLVGDGPEKNRMVSLIKKHNLENVVTMTGQLDRPAVRQLMNRSKILLHPAAFEAQGFVILEALHAGMYVICREISDPFHERMKRCEDVDQMADTVSGLLKSDMSYFKADVPLATNTARKYANVYRQMVGPDSDRSYAGESNTI